VTPLCTADGIVMINRGFIEAGMGGWKPQPAPPAAAPMPAAAQDRRSRSAACCAERWQGAARQRTGAQLLVHATCRRLPPHARPRAVAPYFVDADAASAKAAGPVAGVQPVGGLTVISFVNNHLVYAITWYALALMVAAAVVWVIRDARKQTT
jgi:surfeit locus 1 family protein